MSVDYTKNQTGRSVALGLIGCGYAGKTHAEAVLENGRASLVSICDVDEGQRESVRKIVEAEGVQDEELRSCGEFEEMEFGDLDGVIIATPHRYHAEQAIAALRQGVNVLVEKPLAITPRQARNIKSETENTGAFLYVGYQKRLESRYYTAKRLIENGRIGDIENISITRVKHTESPYRDEWRANPAFAGGGQLFDIGNHMIDLTLWLTESSPVEVEAVLSSREDANMEVYANVLGSLKDGSLFDVSIHAYGNPSLEKVYVSGSDASMEITKGGVTLYEDETGESVPLQRADYDTPVDVLVDSIVGEPSVDTDIDRWIESVEFTQEVYDKCQIK